jgi:hypothetical protein
MLTAQTSVSNTAHRFASPTQNYAVPQLTPLHSQSLWQDFPYLVVCWPCIVLTPCLKPLSLFELFLCIPLASLLSLCTRRFWHTSSLDVWGFICRYTTRCCYLLLQFVFYTHTHTHTYACTNLHFPHPFHSYFFPIWLDIKAYEF